MKFIDLTGQTIGRWTVLYRSDRVSSKGDSYFMCQCECGVKKEIRGTALRSGKSLSCGCYAKEIISKMRSSNIHTNQYDLSGEYGIGYCSNGEFYFDKEDFNKIKDYCWNIDSLGYVTTKEAITGNRYKMHRMLKDFPENKLVDHKNGIKHDNRQSNLRICGYYENNWNSKLKKNKYGHKNLYYDNKSDTWYIIMKVYGNKYKSQRFKTKEEALNCRKEMEEQLQGEFRYEEEIQHKVK